MIESFNFQIRKIIKNRGHFPTDDAAIKLIWLAIADIEDKRARQRAAEAGKPRTQSRQAPGRMVEGAGVYGWKQAFNELEMFFPGRIPVDVYWLVQIGRYTENRTGSPRRLLQLAPVAELPLP